MAYQRDDIERVRSASDLVQLFEEVTTVRKRGRTVMAICPFHQEKTPSLSIDPARNLFHCFSCQAGGDLFRFVQETQGLDFGEAVEWLARRAGIALRPDPKAAAKRGEREALVEAVGRAADFYHQRLLRGSDAGQARSYLRGRGYDVRVLEQFKLGYSPLEWDGLVSHLRSSGVGERSALAAGLAVRSRQGRLVDRFRGRVMFPIYDLRGDPVGFGARLLEGQGPKYLNSPETRLYEKSRLLYGLSWSKADIVRLGYALVVEGYTDVIALHQAGLPVAVATCGTALGEEHFKLLGRFTARAVLAFDADQAGAGASLRGVELATPAQLGLDLRVALLPGGKDPADLVQEGQADALRRMVEKSEPLLQFWIEEELERFDLDEPEARGRAVRAAAPLVGRHPDPLVRQEYASLLSRRTGVGLPAVVQAVERAGGTGKPAHPRPQPPRERLSGPERAERELLRVLLANQPEARRLDVDGEVFTREDHRFAFELLLPVVTALPPGEPPDLGSLLGDDDTATGRLLRALALDERPLADPGELYGRLRAWALERRIDGLRRGLEGLDPEREAEDYSRRLQELVALEAAKRQAGSRT
ncbi:MAG: DNA primase [Actinomycetota bacterium]|nr:DNA primase [Actinomycetota bacterium]